MAGDTTVLHSVLLPPAKRASNTNGLRSFAGTVKDRMRKTIT